MWQSAFLLSCSDTGLACFKQNLRCRARLAFHDLIHEDACMQVFFHAESDEAKQKQKQRKQSAISGTHMLLWLPHFHDFCLTVGILGCGMKG